MAKVTTVGSRIMNDHRVTNPKSSLQKSSDFFQQNSAMDAIFGIEFYCLEKKAPPIFHILRVYTIYEVTFDRMFIYRILLTYPYNTLC